MPTFMQASSTADTYAIPFANTNYFYNTAIPFVAQAGDLIVLIGLQNAPSSPSFQGYSGGIVSVSDDGSNAWNTHIPGYFYAQLTNPITSITVHVEVSCHASGSTSIQIQYGIVQYRGFPSPTITGDFSGPGPTHYTTNTSGGVPVTGYSMVAIFLTSTPAPLGDGEFTGPSAGQGTMRINLTGVYNSSLDSPEQISASIVDQLAQGQATNNTSTNSIIVCGALYTPYVPGTVLYLLEPLPLDLSTVPSGSVTVQMWQNGDTSSDPSGPGSGFPYVPQPLTGIA